MASFFTDPNHQKNENILDLLTNRGLKEKYWRSFQHKTQVSHQLIHRLGLAKNLEGHSGCVNCIEFNETGNLLLSGSDDFNIILWDVNKKQKLKSISTGHRGNIFSVKFLPETDNVIASGAGDCSLEVREIQSGELLKFCNCHSERIKRIATVPCDPSLLFTASEDGTVLQFDTRQKHTCSSSPKNVLVNLKNYVARPAEIKCVTVHPLRTELIAVGANDPFIRVYDRRMIRLTRCHRTSSGRFSRNVSSSTDRQGGLVEPGDLESSENLPPGCVQYFVPGHLPSKMKQYYKRYRSLATTYLSYSSDGRHLLANLGGDHIYLFDTLEASVPKTFSTPTLFNDETLMEGTTPSCSGFEQMKLCPIPPTAMMLPPRSEFLRENALQMMKKGEFTEAIEIYNSLLQNYPLSVLYSSRASALMERKWDGDAYAALRDYKTALELDPTNTEAKLRQVSCMQLLGFDRVTHCTNSDKSNGDPKSSFTELVFELSSAGSKQGAESRGSDSDKEDDEGQVIPPVTAQEQKWRSMAKDYEKVFCGHCNTTTDIKEAIFIGKAGQFIAAGSDDGNLFIWDRHTTNLVKILRADSSIVNCVQAHPSVCMLATSGIESVVKLWSPLAELDDTPPTDKSFMNKISRENQQRMSTDPVEMMILQMGDFVDGWVEVNNDLSDRQQQNCMQCRPS